MSDSSAGRDRPSGAPAARTRGVNPFDRLFPGPAATDPRTVARLESIARAQERRSTTDRQRTTGRETQAGQDTERLIEALHEQTEVLRAVLDADIAIRDDARATAQNSRTYAVAGTIIAFFTMVAAVVTVVIAFAQ